MDRVSTEQLFEDNLPLVKFFARRYASLGRNIRGFDYDDLLQEAQIGLWEACAVYDPDKGALATIAGLRIRCRLMRVAGEAGRYKRRAHMTAVSIDAPLTADDENFSLADLLPSEDNPERDVLLKLTLIKTRKRIPVKIKRVLDLLLAGHSPIEIANQLGVSKQLIQQRRQKIKDAYACSVR
jgi:RNA polymerase sigma factor (sigma-70 family)